MYLLNSHDQKLPQYIRITNGSYPEVSSPANRICLCENDKPTNKCDNIKKIVFPGQEFNVSLIALGELNGSVGVTVRARPKAHSYIKVYGLTKLYNLNITCSNFRYSPPKPRKFTTTISITYKIRHEACENSQKFVIEVNFSVCPPGINIHL